MVLCNICYKNNRLLLRNLNLFETNPVLANFILKVASGQSSLEECKVWFMENTVAA